MDIIIFANVCVCMRACVRACVQFVRFKLKDPIVNWIALNASRCHGLRKK